jgi:hypothetical protein
MTLTLPALLILTFVATWWSRRLAVARGRSASAWALATALLPPVVLLLWALPARTIPAGPA